jgi:hypothetical protein
MKKPCQFEGGDESSPCRDAAVSGERFCPFHRRIMLQRMRSSGYLQTLPKEVIRNRPKNAPADWDPADEGFTVDETHG